MKLCSAFFSNCVLKIVNLSFVTGIFPDLCQIAKVVSIFKKDDLLKCNNYRSHSYQFLVKFLRNSFIQECTHS